jgi:hypothetical protein
VLFWCLPVFCFCQSTTGGRPKTNQEILEESISAELEKFIYSPGVNRNFQFIFRVNPKSREVTGDSSTAETKFLTSLIKKTASANKLNFSFANQSGVDTDSNSYLMELEVYNLETRYPGFKKNSFLGEKTLERNILAKVAVNLWSGDRKFSLTGVITADVTDEIDFDGYESLESARYYFTRAEPPRVGAFERIIFPVILITVTAVTTILFFIIRSK